MARKVANRALALVPPSWIFAKLIAKKTQKMGSQILLSPSKFLKKMFMELDFIWLRGKSFYQHRYDNFV